MKQLPLDNTYVLLSVFLAPAKSESTIELLKNIIIKEEFELGPLLLQANIQMCTPLWYSQLKHDCLLKYFPEEYQKVLQTIYEANADRNQILKEGLSEILIELEKTETKSILLKGAATFVDDLYGSLGARFMGDIDILVAKDEIETCESILKKLQYEVVVNENLILDIDKHPTDERQQHIHPRMKPNTPLLIEIHFKPAFGQGGRIITSKAVWKDKVNCVVNKQSTAIFDPTNRLLLNTTHGLIAEREFMHGFILLRQLAEFSTLAIRYQDSIDWSKWYKVAVDNNLKVEFITYLSLAHHLMEVPWPDDIPKLMKKGFHYQRIINKGGALSRVKDSKESTKEKFIRVLGDIYFWIRFPRWVWINTCYAPKLTDFPDRVRILFKKLF
ncbi:MAG: nucleotidyltransferase family protein, partial [Gammaproteobacteria bacterium]|nr:nucleotidyltransferase family protein [Gammaproteobacteria bacterium]